MLEARSVPKPPPALSIFVPVRNGAPYLAAALDSLLGQDFRDLEIVVADDGSSDETPAIARAYAARDPRLRVLVLPARGEVAARNAALAACHPGSRYLMNHDCDDLSLAGKLRALVEHLEAHPELAVVGCRARYFDDAGRSLGEPPIELEPERIRATFGRVNSVLHSTALIRRRVFDRLGGYCERWRSVDDYDLFARALLAGFELANLPAVLHRIRVHPDSIGSRRRAEIRLKAEQVGARYEWTRSREHGALARLEDWLRYRKRLRRAHRRYQRATAAP